MDFTCVFFGILFIIAGISFAFGKVYRFLSAWKEMPEAEKEKIRIEPLCRNIGAIISLNGIIFILNGFCSAVTDTMFTFAIIGWMILAGVDVYYISKSNRYKKQ